MRALRSCSSRRRAPDQHSLIASASKIVPATQVAAADFDAKLFALSPENFGSAANRKYTFHSIIGIGEKAVPTDTWLATEGRVPSQPSASQGKLS